MKAKRVMALTVVALATAGIGTAQADTIPAVAVVPNPVGGVISGGDQTYGFAFIAQANVTVVALGAFDLNADGLSEAHSVGVWDANTNLLVSATIPSGSATLVVDSFRYTSISPLVLSAGTQYV